MKYYLVTGRVCGDDEDTSLTFFCDTKEQAVTDYRETMWELDGTSKDERWLMEACDQGVFINGVFVSDTPITSL